MLLTELAETIAELLNSSPESWCGDETGIEARVTLDWAGCLRKTALQVLVVPEMNQYQTEAAGHRKHFVNIGTLKFISIMVGKGFNSLPTSDDVAPWEETKSLLDIRERVTQFVIANPIEGASLQDIEEMPVDELELNHRNFLAMNQLGYEIIQCGSGPDLSSLSTGLSVESGRALSRAYTRRLR